MSPDLPLVERLNEASKLNFLKKYKKIPSLITKNLNPRFVIREYQREAMARLSYYLTDFPDRTDPLHLLFHMATGSGKTLLMASNVLYLYDLGYRNFIFFVNSTTILEKTKNNLLEKNSFKYLFASQIIFDNRKIIVDDVENFEAVSDDNINILFTTIQGLHSRMNNPKENSITFEDFEEKKFVFLSDEAHHLSAFTKKQSTLTKEDLSNNSSWENTVCKIFENNKQNILLEYTATLDLEHRDIFSKYKDKILFSYTLKEFREDKFSKDIKIMKSDLSLMQRALQAVLLSQYRRKIAETNKIQLKPVILMKSQRTIAQSQKSEQDFKDMIQNLELKDIDLIRKSNHDTIISKAFSFFKQNNISDEFLIREIQNDFSDEKILSVNSKTDSTEKQMIVNTLEDSNNEIRLIFTVNMLNEGWDVLNLFDIVRLYETRDVKNNKPGKTTVSEAQLIGRGARYFPFGEKDSFYTRKYDHDSDNDCRILEELHYHTLNDVRYISELTAELTKTGLLDPDERKKRVTVAIKKELKQTNFWKNALIFTNQREKVDRKQLTRIRDILPDNFLTHKIPIGKTTEIALFQETQEEFEKSDNFSARKVIKLNEIEKNILRKALDKNSFYRFINLKKYFPSLQSIDEFMTSDFYLGEIDIEVYGSQSSLYPLKISDKYQISLKVLKKLEEYLEKSRTEYYGTKTFSGQQICTLLKSPKTSDILIGGSDKEFGIAMSETSKNDLRLNIKDQDWYLYNENYGTSEEKYFIQFIAQSIKALRKKYKDVYLLRNERLFKIYQFSDGRAFEPDFVLFLTEKKTKKELSFQLFVEPKGKHLLRMDEWKEKFLKEIQSHSIIIDLFDTSKYRLIGLPFFNEQQTKKSFEKEFNKSLCLGK